MRYYNTLADQIDSACARGALQCLPPRATLLPPFRREYLGESLHASKGIARVLFRMSNGPIAPLPDTAPTEDLAIFTDTVDGVIPPSKDSSVIMGWVAGATAVPTLRVVANGSEQFESSVKGRPAPDVVLVYPTLKSVRFELKTDCPVAACNVVLEVAGKEQARVPLSELVRSDGHAPVINDPALKLNIEAVPGFLGRKFADSRRAAQVKIASVIASAYANVFPVLAIFGAAGLLLATLFRKRFPLPTGVLALGLASAGAVAVFLVLMSYLQASSDFPIAGNVLYISPASPFVIVFTFVGVYSWLAAVRSAVFSSATLHADPVGVVAKKSQASNSGL
jgi:hypothetical protein